MSYAAERQSLPSRPRVHCLLAAFVLLSASVFGDARAMQSPQATPREIVMQATGELMAALRVSGNDIRANPRLARRLADDIIFPHVDFEQIGRYVLGKHWRQATPAQRERFTSEFRDFAADFLVRVMVQFSSIVVEYADKLRYPEMPYTPGDTRTTVRMYVTPRTGVNVTVDYRMNNTNGVWQIHDVTMEGISMVLTHRASFAHEINNKGFDGLIESMATHNRQRAAADVAN